jgi:two-component system, NtrC family, nitrogen regulation sensor histidine kinase NtrY
MGYKRFTLTIIISICIIVISTFLAAYLTFLNQNSWYLVILFPVPFITISILYNLNQSNRQIAYFFEAIKNEDSSLKFPTSIKQKSLHHLYQNLNNLNEQIKKIKLHNEYLEKYYHAFIQHAATGLMVITQDNAIEIMNDKAFEYVGIPTYTPLHLVPSRNPELFNILTLIASGEAQTFKRYTIDYQINVLIRSKEIHFGEKIFKLISLQDIRHELDEKELDAWQMLIRVLTHEIMNSIAPIVSLSGTLRQFFTNQENIAKTDMIDKDTIENVIQGLDTIEERGKGLINFVNSYRKLTRIPIPEFTSFNVKEWLEHIQLLLHDQLVNHKISFELFIDQKIKMLSGDKELLTQVIINILNNAMEALEEIPENRKIKVSLDLSKYKRTLIQIINNGPIISKETMEKIFIPFYTTKEQGSGIGLSLSRQILRLHKGYIHAESTEKMTSFIITL